MLCQPVANQAPCVNTQRPLAALKCDWVFKLRTLPVNLPGYLPFDVIPYLPAQPVAREYRKPCHGHDIYVVPTLCFGRGRETFEVVHHRLGKSEFAQGLVDEFASEIFDAALEQIINEKN